MTKQPGVWGCASACLRVCVCLPVFDTNANKNCWLFHSWCFPRSPLVADKCFPTVFTCRRLQTPHTHMHTQLDPEAYMAMPDIIGCFYKKTEPLLFFPVSTEAAVQLNSSILSSSISRGCEIGVMETAFAVQKKEREKKSSKRLHEASNDAPTAALGALANGLHLPHACHIWVWPCATCSVGYHERVDVGAGRRRAEESVLRRRQLLALWNHFTQSK